MGFSVSYDCDQVGEDCRLSAEDIANSVQQISNMIHATCIGYIKEWCKQNCWRKPIVSTSLTIDQFEIIAESGV